MSEDSVESGPDDYNDPLIQDLGDFQCLGKNWFIFLENTYLCQPFQFI